MRSVPLRCNVIEYALAFSMMSFAPVLPATAGSVHVAADAPV
jgi:hypothetical protein